MTWAEIAELRVDGREPIPLMRDLLERWPDVRFNIDCKADSAVEALAELIERHRRDRPRVHRCVQSPPTATAPPPARARDLLTALESAGGGLAAVHRPASPDRRTRARRCRHGGRGRTEAGGFVPIVTPSFVRRAHAVGVPVHVWTIDDEAEMHRLLDLGVDGIMTDRPELLRSVFESARALARLTSGGWRARHHRRSPSSATQRRQSRAPAGPDQRRLRDRAHRHPDDAGRRADHDGDDRPGTAAQPDREDDRHDHEQRAPAASIGSRSRSGRSA